MSRISGRRGDLRRERAAADRAGAHLHRRHADGHDFRHRPGASDVRPREARGGWLTVVAGRPN